MNKLKVGVIGLGIGESYLKALTQMQNAEIGAICDIDEEKMKRISEKYGVEKTYADYREMIRDGGLDAVCVCTPDYEHVRMVSDSLKAGKDVLCEKPLALCSEECEEMILAARKYKRKLMVGQVCRLTPSFIKAKKLVDAGIIGELYFVESEYAHDYSDMGKCWRSDPKNHRHPVTGGGCHAVDLLRWIAGNPTEVYAASNKKTLVDWPCDDTAIGILKFPDNVKGKVYVSTGCKRNYTMRTVLYGTKGTIIVDNTNPTLSLFLAEMNGNTEFFGTKMRNIEMKIPVSTASHNILGELRMFCDAVINDEEVAIPAEEGAATVAVCEALIRSAASGQPEQVIYLK